MEKRILLVEDDQNLGMILQEYLNAKGYKADLKTDGEQGFDAFKKNDYDICIFDVMMPKKDGFTLAKEVKAINPEMPIMFLTAKSMKHDVIEGFQIGADDYLSKPFNMEELTARINVILKRTSKENTLVKLEKYKIGIFDFDTKTQTLTNGNETKKLTTKEADLLEILCQHLNSVLERNLALNKIWGDDNIFNARSMDVYITKLRKYLKSDENIEIINVHGKGYKLLVNN